MSDSPGPGGDAQTMNDVKNARIRAADIDDGGKAVPAKYLKIDENVEDGLDDEDPALDDDDDEQDFDEDDDDDDVGNGEDIDFDDEDEVEEGGYVEGIEGNPLDETGESSDLDEFLQVNLGDIEGCQAGIETLNKQANDEILKVEQKYNKLRQPVYTRRNTYIDKIPSFWATVFSRHPQLKRVLSNDDLKCLKHLTNLQIDDFEDSRSGYRIKFTFSKNPWFSNLLITKEYHLPWNDSPSCICTSIDWRPGMDLTKKQSSFFSWFCSQEDASTDDIAEIIKEELWPNPLPAYLTKENGEVDSEESDEDDDEPVYIDDDNYDDEPEYISSDGEDEEDYGRQPALEKDGDESEPQSCSLATRPSSKEVPGFNKREQFAADGDDEDGDFEGEIDDDLSSPENEGFGDEDPEDLEDAEDLSKQSRDLEENDDLADFSSRDVDDEVTDRRDDDVALDEEAPVASQDEIQSKEVSQTPVDSLPLQTKEPLNDPTSTVEETDT